jgi:PAS domain S-box-containing protein
MSTDHKLTGIQTEFARNSILVSKTNPNGVIIYANPDFCRVAGYGLEDLIGKPHSCIRHPDMPRAVFSLMWDTLKEQREFFGYVVNRCADGNHYWVFAQVVPDIDPDTGETVSFHSTRRWADAAACRRAKDVYRMLLDAEAQERSPRAAVTAGRKALEDILSRAGMTYEQWAFSLANH